MGNQTQRESLQKRSRVSKSFDYSHFASKMNEKIYPVNLQSSEEKNQNDVEQKQSMKRSYSISDRKYNEQKLFKLNQKNDELRKQLILISEKLTNKLQKKKFQIKPKQIEINDKEQKSFLAVKKQLENGYRQIDRYKKILDEKKNNDSVKNDEALNLMQNKISTKDKQILKVMNDIEAIKNIEKNQQKFLKKDQQQQSNPQIAQIQSQIQKMRIKLRNISKVQRQRQIRQKNNQQYMFQLDRRLREMNGEYLPEIKSYANKNFQPDFKYEKKKKNELGSYKPAKWQIQDAEQELKQLKEKHQVYNKKISKALKIKNQMKQEQKQIKDLLQIHEKNLQILKYKKDRYLQLVMGNLQYLMNQEQPDMLSNSDSQGNGNGMRSVIKGKDVEGQVLFDDHDVLESASFQALKIVTINVWLNQKKQITAIQSLYTSGLNFYVGKPSSKVEEQWQKQVFQVDEGDYLKNIMGSFSKKGAIQFLAFNSSRGKAKQFGKELINGSNFSLALTKKQRPVCISGASFLEGSSYRINKLIIDIVADQ